MSAELATAAITKITPLLKELIERVKDGKTASLVQEVQSSQQTILAYVHELQMENIQLKTESLKNQQRLMELKQKLTTTNPANACPYCGFTANWPVDIKSHPTFATMGLKIAYYKCGQCGKDYDKEQQPPSSGVSWGSEPRVDF